ncbi:hypothetical protein [Corynebacterium diphtheriae]|uniref:hypothetical protein n=1 Tax=Corynebacterium diphtheriae TaxID=1717 RepID=UPI0011603BB7|nr:hypothetical protein [Corynebacterium diphtheriae]
MLSSIRCGLGVVIVGCCEVSLIDVHQRGLAKLRRLGRCVACGDRKGVSAALKKVYTAFDEA